MGAETIEHTEKYCYLGILFHRNGSFTPALDELRAKSTRALYSLKGKIIKGSLSFKSLMTLFDSLIKPVFLYGCQVLAPYYKTMNFLSKISPEKSPDSILKYIAQDDSYEKFHLKFLKWSLGVHSKSSNIGCWGDTGRYPLFFEASKLAIDYFERVKSLKEGPENTLLKATFKVQQALNLDWHNNISKLVAKYNTATISKTRTSTRVYQGLKKMFVRQWQASKESSPKLEFYNSVKTEFQPDNYLHSIANHHHRASVTRLRISSHNLYIERGRYERPLVPRDKRHCLFCVYQFGLKSEMHVLQICPLYNWCRRNHTLDQLTLQGISKIFKDKNKEVLCLFGKFVHSVLQSNENFVQYYKLPDFHTNTGNCLIL